MISALFAHHLLGYVLPRRAGYVLDGNPGILLARNPDRIRCPDVCFIAAERLPGGPPAHYLGIAPDLIVEIVSPSDSAAAVRGEMDE